MGNDVTVASTTDTVEQVNQAAGYKQEEAVVEEKALPTGDEQVESGAEEQHEEPPKQEEDKSAPKNLSKRFDKLYKEKKQLEERLAALEAAKVAPVAEERPAVPVEVTAKFPTFNAWAQEQIEDGKSAEMEDWLEERDAWKDARRVQEEEKQAEKAYLQEIEDTYSQSVEAFKAEHEDWDEVVGGAEISIPVVAGNAIKQLENGPAVVWFLATNPKDAKKLSEMPPVLAVAEIGRIAARLEKMQPEENAQSNGKGPDKAPIVSSNAPKPITPLRGGQLRATRDLNDPNLSYDEYRKIRDEQEKARFRR